jgi:NAD(P)-dependent dehydrogenase (short-subunit alcohol dehydrogenase family)
MNRSWSELYSLEGRVAIVTGANGLLGRRHVEALQNAGGTVIGVDIDEMDVTDEASIRVIRDHVLQKHGRIDVIVNNAAMNDAVENSAHDPTRSMFENYPLELWRRVLDVNVTGMFLCSQVFGATMKEQGHGSIINIASTYGIVAPDQALYREEDGTQSFYKGPAYPTSKGAVIMFTKYLAAYWGSAGVRVNALSPGGVKNGQPSAFVQRYSQRTPLGRMASDEDYMGALVFLASDASLYMTGQNLVVDGGWTTW